MIQNKINFTLSGKEKRVMLTILVLGSFTSLLNQTLLNVAIPELSEVFQIELSTAQWLVTGFIMVNGIVIPITAYLIGKFSTRQLFLGALLIFATGTILSAFSPNFNLLLTGRLIQAIAGGIMMPLVQTVIFTLYPPNQRGKAMGMVGIAMTFAPALGPTLSGWILQHYSWRMLFYIVIPIAIINIVMAFFFLQNVTEKTNPKFDLSGVVTSTIGFGSLLYGFSMAGNQGWDSTSIIATLIIGIIFIGLFIWRQLTADYPMLNLRVFTNKQYLITIGIVAFVALAMYSVELLTPVYVQHILGHSTLQTGLVLLPGAIIMGIMSPIAGSILDKYGIRPLVFIGMTLVVVMSYFYTTLSTDSSLVVVSVTYTSFMFGISLMMMTAMTFGLNQLPPAMSKHGAAASNTVRMLSGSIGTALLTTIMTTQSKSYLPKLQEKLPKEEAFRHANVLGMHDAFSIITVAGIAIFIITLFLTKKKEI
ncbi:multidrug MFS transporter [Bacillus sp. Leaf13]|nr:multidrug MFS transporter [Bacillus sp. Leaf13]